MLKHLEIKAALGVDDAGAITGTAWVFDQPDRMGDIITKGAFAGVSGRVPMLFAHNPAEPVGYWDSVVEDEKGLTVAGKLMIDDVARAKEARALIREKAITGLSIGFSTKSATARKGGGRVISAVDLVEISLVTIPAHPKARIQTVKSAEAAIAIAEAINRAASALKLGV